MTSRYHGSKICGSQQSFFTEKVICIDERWKKNTVNYRFVPEWNHAQESHNCQFFFISAIFTRQWFGEIQAPVVQKVLG